MAEAKHTPGPWNACFRTFDARVEAFHITCEKYGSLRPVCETPSVGASAASNADEIAANAHLIAAAPELLTAGHAFVESIFHSYSIPPDADDDFIRDEVGSVVFGAFRSTRDAIAKAEGRP